MSAEYRSRLAAEEYIRSRDRAPADQVFPPSPYLPTQQQQQQPSAISRVSSFGPGPIHGIPSSQPRPQPGLSSSGGGGRPVELPSGSPFVTVLHSESPRSVTVFSHFEFFADCLFSYFQPIPVKHFRFKDQFETRVSFRLNSNLALVFAKFAGPESG